MPGRRESALRAIDAARAVARSQVWTLAGEHAPNHGADAAAPTAVGDDYDGRDESLPAHTPPQACGFSTSSSQPGSTALSGHVPVALRVAATDPHARATLRRAEWTVERMRR